MRPRAPVILTILAAHFALLGCTPARSADPEPLPPRATEPADDQTVADGALRAGWLDVGDPAPPLTATTWLNGRPIRLDGDNAANVTILVFWAPWSGPSRAALADLIDLYQEYSPRKVAFAGISEDPADDVRQFLDVYKPRIPFPLAIDEHGASTRAWCRTAGVGFLPYAFVIGPDHKLAWHGHPQQEELVTVVKQLLNGKYDVEQARQMVRRSRSIEQLEAVFRDACANESWHTALMALDALLDTDVPKQRLLRYKLSIQLGELDDLAPAHQLADELFKRYADDYRFLNSVAWDLLTDRRLFERDPEMALRFAQTAYHGTKGADAVIADTYARLLHMLGRLDLAIKVQRMAVEHSTAEQRPEHERTLQLYERCQALQERAAREIN